MANRALCALEVRRRPTSTLFPYTTLFRSRRLQERCPRTARKERRRGLRRQTVRRCTQRLHLQSKLEDRKSTRLNSSHVEISYAVFCLKKKKDQGARVEAWAEQPGSDGTQQ